MTTSEAKSSTGTEKGSAARTTFVLAGGGSFGAVQVGMLRALVEHGVAADAVIGSSVGAINGAWFAGSPHAGGVARLESIWRGLRRSDIFPLTWRAVAGLLGRRDFVVDPGALRALLEQHLPYREIREAAVPLHVVATDLLGGGTVRLSDGPVVEAVMASCAIPAAFPPVRVGERYLIDGAVAANTPISVAVECGAERVIVLPTGFACALKVPPRGALACALQAITLLTAHQLVGEIEQLRGRVEIITVPPLCPLAVSPYDFSRGAELIERAAEQTRRWLAGGGLSRERVPAALRAHTD
jgi:NTE family protein